MKLLTEAERISKMKETERGMNMKDLKEEIFTLECSHIHPDVRVSKEKLGEVLDDEFLEIGSSGHITVRADYNEDDSLTPDDMEITDFQMHPLAPDAVLTTYRIFNKTTGRKTLRSSIWKKRPTGWKLFFHQGTPTS